MVLIKRFLLMVQFLTTLPLSKSFRIKEEDFGKGLIFAPLVGLLLGSILTLVFMLLGKVFPPYITAVFTVVAYVLLTGGLHMDGLGDTFDGLFSRRPKERMLEIMKDSRVGTNAVLAIVCVILLDVVLLAHLEGLSTKAILLMPIAGRMSLVLGAGISQYARKDGLARSFIQHCGVKEALVGLGYSFALFFWTHGWEGVIIGGITMGFSVLILQWFTRKIDGATGDILGGVCELTQVAFLVVMYVYGVQ